MTAIYLGRPTGPRLRGLTLEQERMLDGWLSYALANPPKRGDSLPIDFTRALSQIAKRRGITIRFDGERRNERHSSPALGKNIPGCVGGSKRTVKASDTDLPVHRFGKKVEPWNERPWRDDNL